MLALKKTHMARKKVKFNINTREHFNTYDFPVFPRGRESKDKMLLPLLKFNAFTYIFFITT